MKLKQIEKSFFDLPDSAPLVVVKRTEQKIYVASAFDFIGRSSIKDCEFLEFPLLVKGEKIDYSLFLTRRLLKGQYLAVEARKKFNL